MQEEWELKDILVNYDVEKATENLLRKLWTIDFFREDFSIIHSIIQEFFVENDIQLYTEYDADTFIVSFVFRIFFPREQIVEQFEEAIKNSKAMSYVELTDEQAEELYKRNIGGYAFEFEYVLPKAGKKEGEET